MIPLSGDGRRRRRVVGRKLWGDSENGVLVRTIDGEGVATTMGLAD